MWVAGKKAWIGGRKLSALLCAFSNEPTKFILLFLIDLIVYVEEFHKNGWLL